jgi:hypothetical protein
MNSEEMRQEPAQPVNLGQRQHWLKVMNGIKNSFSHPAEVMPWGIKIQLTHEEETVLRYALKNLRGRFFDGSNIADDMRIMRGMNRRAIKARRRNRRGGKNE